MKNRNTIFTAILLALGFLALLPSVHAVSPAPDGGYPGNNTAEGQDALLSLTTGSSNTAVGSFALESNTTGGSNTAIGALALSANTGNQNTATGAAALYSNTTGRENTATGSFALSTNTSGFQNTATGHSALKKNSTGYENTAIGFEALDNNTSGSSNTAAGYQALYHNTVGTTNTAIGLGALSGNTTGSENIGIGYNTLIDNTTGVQNVAVGDGALGSNTVGHDNVAFGLLAGFGVTTANNVICIGDRVSGSNVSNSCYIGNIFQATSSGGSAVYVNMNGKLGTSTSSRRFKNEIKPMERVSEALFALKPVSFRYKKGVDPEGDGKTQFGLIAEEVEKVNRDLVVRDKDGQPYSVRYDQVNAMLLNEFLKEHRKVQKLEAALDTISRRLQAQDAKIDKVNAKLGLSRSAPQIAFSDR